LPKPQTSGAKSDGRFGKQDFVYLPKEGRLSLSGWGAIAISLYQRRRSATGPQPVKIVYSNPSAQQGQSGGVPRWELDAVQQRLDANPLAMRQRRETVEHPFGTMKARWGDTLPQQNASKSSRRDDSLGPGL
jgi:hypothetical protein